MFELLPAYGLANTIVVPVVIGILVVFALHELYGWVFSGLIAPGYLAVLIYSMPSSAAMIGLESVLCYLSVRGLSWLARRSGFGHEFFGRDRFFMFVVFSVLLRILLETGETGRAFRRTTGAVFGIDEQIVYAHSIGLVLIPLVANSFWKTGLSTGLLRIGITTSLAYLGLLGFATFANLDLTLFSLLYEDVALRFSDTSKVYVIILITAAVSSSRSLKYGWDVNGILVPSLFAVTIFMPMKAGTTIIEALLCLIGFKLMLRLPYLRSLDLSGNRPIVVMILISLAIKWAISIWHPTWWEGLRPSDLFGFGYALPALMAVKMHQRGSVVLILSKALNMTLIGLIYSALCLVGLSALDAWSADDSDIEAPGDSQRLHLVPALAEMMATQLTSRNGVPPRLDILSQSNLGFGFAEVLRTADPRRVCEAARKIPGRVGVSVRCNRLVIDDQRWHRVDVEAANRLDGSGWPSVLVRAGHSGPIVFLGGVVDTEGLFMASSVVNGLDASAVVVPGTPLTLSEARQLNDVFVDGVLTGSHGRSVVTVVQDDEVTSPTWFLPSGLGHVLTTTQIRTSVGHSKVRFERPAWRLDAFAKHHSLHLVSPTRARIELSEKAIDDQFSAPIRFEGDWRTDDILTHLVLVPLISDALEGLPLSIRHQRFELGMARSLGVHVDVFVDGDRTTVTLSKPENRFGRRDEISIRLGSPILRPLRPWIVGAKVSLDEDPLLPVTFAVVEKTDAVAWAVENRQPAPAIYRFDQDAGHRTLFDLGSTALRAAFGGDETFFLRLSSNKRRHGQVDSAVISTGTEMSAEVLEHDARLQSLASTIRDMGLRVVPFTSSKDEVGLVASAFTQTTWSRAMGDGVAANVGLPWNFLQGFGEAPWLSRGLRLFHIPIYRSDPPRLDKRRHIDADRLATLEEQFLHAATDLRVSSWKALRKADDAQFFAVLEPNGRLRFVLHAGEVRLWAWAGAAVQQEALR